MTDDHRLEPGSEFLDWEIEEWIGDGNFSDVYLAWHRRREAHEALKILAPADTRLSPSLRFERELEVLQSLRNVPQVIPIFDWGEEDGRLGFSMRYIEGPVRTLEDLLAREGSLSIEEALEIFQPIAQGLDKIWEKLRLLHRDVAPSNILIEQGEDRSWTGYLADFGLVVGPGKEHYTPFAGQIIGRQEYAAPERLDEPLARQLGLDARKDLVDSRADQYSLACCVYQSLTGQLPYEIKSYEDLRVVRDTAPPIPRELGPGMERVEDALAKGLSVDRDDRFDSSCELLDAIAAGAREAPERESRRSRRVPIGAALGLALLGLVAIAALLALAINPDEPARETAAEAIGEQSSPEERTSPSTGPAESRPEGGAGRPERSARPQSPRVTIEVVKWCFCDFYDRQWQLKFKPRVTNRSSRSLPIQPGPSSPLVLRVVGLEGAHSWPSPLAQPFRSAEGATVLVPPNPNDRTTGDSEPISSTVTDYPVATHWYWDTIEPGETLFEPGPREGVLVYNVPEGIEEASSVKLCYKLPGHTPYCPAGGIPGNWPRQTAGVF